MLYQAAPKAVFELLFSPAHGKYTCQITHYLTQLGFNGCGVNKRAAYIKSKYF